MTIAQIREKIIKEFIAGELLEDNVFPTLELVCAIALRDYKQTEVFTSLLNEKLLINQNVSASAAQINRLSDLTNIDIVTLYKFVDFLGNRLTEQKSAIQQKIASFSLALKKLNEKVNGLILLNEDNNSLSETFVENFSSLDNIDAGETTAIVDVYKRQVSVKNNNPVNSDTFNDAIDSVSISCTTPRYIKMSSITDHHIGQLYDGNEDTIAIYEITMPPDYKGAVDIRIKIRLKTLVSFNHIYLKLKDMDTTERFESSALVFINNKWTTISDYKTYDANVEMFFDTVTTQDLVINVRMGSYRIGTDGPIYSFYGKELIVDSCDFSGTETVVTKGFEPANKFNIIGLKADSIIANGCSIDYFVSWRILGQWSEYSKIDPNNYLSVLPNEELQKSTHRIDFTYLHPYNSGNNICYSYTSVLEPQLNLYKSKIIRNLGNFSEDAEQSPICYFHLDTVKAIDFAVIPGYIDGEYVSSLKNIGGGIHKFILKNKNDISLCSSYLTSNEIIFGSHLASYINPMEFVNIAEDDNYKLFTIQKVTDKYGSPVFTTIAKRIIANERIQFLKQVITTPNAAEAIKVKSLLTGTGGFTPILKNIKIKIG